MAQNKPTQSYDYLVKVIIIGDSAVGKTNILLRFVNAQYKMTHITTIGVDFKIKTINVDGVRMKMQIWDTAGQDKFKTVTETYYKGAAGVLLVYAINDRRSFLNVQSWLKQMNDNQPENISKIIVGNKVDISDSERQVSRSEGQALAKKYGVLFLESSAKENINISQMFNILGQQIKQNLADSPAKPNSKGVKITDQKERGSKKKQCEC